MSDCNTENQDTSDKANQILVDFCNDIVLSRIEIDGALQWQARMGELGAVAKKASDALYDLAAVLTTHKILMDEGEDFDRDKFSCFFSAPLKSPDEVQEIIDSIAGPFQAKAMRLVNEVSAPEPPPRIGVEVVEGVMFGEPVFIGTGTPLMSVVSRVVEGMFDDDIIADFPQVTSDHIRFARWLVRSFSHYRSK